MFLSRAKALAFLVVLTFALAAYQQLCKKIYRTEAQMRRRDCVRYVYQHVLKQEVNADKALGFKLSVTDMAGHDAPNRLTVLHYHLSKITQDQRRSSPSTQKRYMSRPVNACPDSTTEFLK